MKAVIAALAIRLITMAVPGIAPTHALFTRVDPAAEAVVAEIQLVYPELSLTEQEKRAKISIVWGWYEAGLLANPKGDNDKGGACGYGQIHVKDMMPGVLPPEMTCAALRKNLRTSIRAQLLVMKYLEKTCGSLRGGMTAYATGQCPKKGWTIQLVARRFKEAGVTE